MGLLGKALGTDICGRREGKRREVTFWETMSVESGSFLAWKELFAPWVSVELPVAERKCLGAPKVLVIPFSNGTVISLPVCGFNLL